MDAKHFDILTKVSSSGKENSNLVVCQSSVLVPVIWFLLLLIFPDKDIHVEASSCFSSYGEVCFPRSLLPLPVVKLATVVYRALSQATRKCVFDFFIYFYILWSRDECEITVLKVVFKAFGLQVGRCVWLERTTGLPGNSFSDAFLFSFWLWHCIFVKVCGITK